MLVVHIELHGYISTGVAALKAEEEVVFAFQLVTLLPKFIHLLGNSGQPTPHPRQLLVLLFAQSLHLLVLLSIEKVDLDFELIDAQLELELILFFARQYLLECLLSFASGQGQKLSQRLDLSLLCRDVVLA